MAETHDDAPHADEAPKSGAVASPNLDSLVNAMSGLGTASDKGAATTVGELRRLTEAQLERLYSANIYARRIVDELPDDCVRRGWAIRMQDSQGEPDPFANAFAALGFREAMREAHQYARLYGGAGVVLGIDDGRDASEPVDEAAVRGILFAVVADRHELTPMGRFVSDPTSPHFGLPERYAYAPATIEGNVPSRLSGEGSETIQTATTIHADRVIRIEGRRVPRRMRPDVDHWGDSVLQACWDALRRYGMVSQGAAHIVQEYEVAILKMRGLHEAALSGHSRGGSTAAELVSARALALKLGKGLANMAVLDADAESYERSTAQVSGLAALWDRAASELAGAAGMPVTKILGQSPGGLSTDDASGTRWWYDQVATAQRRIYDAPIRRVARLLAISGQASADPDAPLVVDFAPLHEPTEKERSEQRKLDHEADEIAFRLGVLEPDEIRESAYGGAGYSSDRALTDDATRRVRQRVEDDTPADGDA